MHDKLLKTFSSQETASQQARKRVKNRKPLTVLSLDKTIGNFSDNVTGIWCHSFTLLWRCSTGVFEKQETLQLYKKWKKPVYKMKCQPSVRNQVVDEQNTSKWNFTENDIFFKVHIYRQRNRVKMQQQLESGKICSQGQTVHHSRW